MKFGIMRDDISALLNKVPNRNSLGNRRDEISRMGSC